MNISCCVYYCLSIIIQVPHFTNVSAKNIHICYFYQSLFIHLVYSLLPSIASCWNSQMFRRQYCYLARYCIGYFVFCYNRFILQITEQYMVTCYNTIQQLKHDVGRPEMSFLYATSNNGAIQFHHNNLEAARWQLQKLMLAFNVVKESDTLRAAQYLQ